MHTREYTISVVLYQEGDWWVAQCLEYDIATQAKNPQDLYYEVERTIMGNLVAATEAGLEPLERLPAAPRMYWDMFEKSKLRLEGDKLPFRVPAGLLYPIPTPELRFAAA